jgi:hypothetical protein
MEIASGIALAGWAAASAAWAAVLSQRHLLRHLSTQIESIRVLANESQGDPTRADEADVRVIDGLREQLTYMLGLRNFGRAPASVDEARLVDPDTGETLGIASYRSVIEAPVELAIPLDIATSKPSLRSRQSESCPHPSL